MRILYISASIVPSRNANSVHVMKMSSALQENGNEVTLIATKGDEEVEPFDYYNIKTKFNLILAKKSKYFSSLSRLISALKNVNKNDLIFTRWPLASVIIGLFFDKKIILEYHTYPTSRIQKKLFNINNKLKNVSRYIFITESLKSYFIEKHPEIKYKDCIVIADGADMDSQAKITPLEKNSKLKCCYMGSFLEGKGVDTVVKISNKMKDIEFHIIGGDITTQNILRKQVINNNVKWYGHLKQQEAMNILEQCHIALLPNKNKVYIDKNKDIGRWTSPLKLFEYMSKGKAIIASDIEVLKEILINRENCLLVDPNILEEWVDAINIIKNNISLYEYISYNAKLNLEKKYTWYLRAQKSIDFNSED